MQSQAFFMIGDKIKKIIKNKSGISLMEIQVAVAIFIVIMLSAMSIFKSVMDSQQNAIVAKNIQENLRYILESISKEIRSARRSSGACGVPDGSVYYSNGSELKFINKKGNCVKYYLDDSTLMIDRTSNGVVYNGTTTPSNIRVKEFKVVIPDFGNSGQPRVTLELVVDSLERSINKSDIRVQTTISSRFYN